MDIVYFAIPLSGKSFGFYFQINVYMHTDIFYNLSFKIFTIKPI